MVLERRWHVVVDPMSAQTVQAGLWGDPTPAAAPPKPATSSNDLDLFAAVVKTALDPGYVLVGPSERVFRRDPTRDGHVERVPAHEADMVAQMLDGKHLKTGGHHQVTDGRREASALSVLVPSTTRAQVSRWDALHRLPQPRPEKTKQGKGDVRDRPSCGRILVDVVSPGKGLVTSSGGDFSGVIIRNRGGSGYQVEDEWGTTVGRASSYRAGAQVLARHLGFTPGDVVVEIEKD
jgi:hypothetical protein